MSGFRWKRVASAACAVLGSLAIGCGGDESAPGPAACPEGHEVAGVCAGVPAEPVCEASVCSDGAGCVTVVTVATDAELQAAIAGATSGTCIALSPGTYGDADLPGGVSLLGRSAAEVHLSKVAVAPGDDAVIRGVEVGSGGIEVAAGAHGVRITRVRATGAAEDGIRIDTGASVSIDASEVLGSARRGVLAVDAVSVEIESTVIRGSSGPGVHAECAGGCACAAASSVTVGTSAIRQNGLVGVSLVGVTAALTGVEITDNDVGSGFMPSGGLSASGCSSLTASGLRVLDNSSFGVLVDASSAKLGQAGDSAGMEVSRNLIGVWIQKSGVTAPQPVELENVVLEENSGVAIGFGGGAQGIIVHDCHARKTKAQAMPALNAQGQALGSKEIGDGINWLDGSSATIDGLELSGNARASLLISGSVGSGSAISNLTLSGGDEQKGVLQQSFPSGGVAPAVGSGAPALQQLAAEQFAVPVAPVAPTSL